MCVGVCVRICGHGYTIGIRLNQWTNDDGGGGGGGDERMSLHIK